MGDEAYMERALDLARQCLDYGDVPVGCVVVDPDGIIVGEGRNRREELGDASAHAEVEAIRAACARLGSWRLHTCKLYVTLEPCPMCAGAILNARIPEVHYGVREGRTGACGSVLDLFAEYPPPRPRLYRGPLEDQCAALLTQFFTEKRRLQKNDKLFF